MQAGCPDATCCFHTRISCVLLFVCGCICCASLQMLKLCTLNVLICFICLVLHYYSVLQAYCKCAAARHKHKRLFMFLCMFISFLLYSITMLYALSTVTVTRLTHYCHSLISSHPLLSSPLLSSPVLPSSRFWQGGNNICHVSHWPFGKLLHLLLPLCVFIPSPCSSALHLQAICWIIQYIFHSTIW